MFEARDVIGRLAAAADTAVSSTDPELLELLAEVDAACNAAAAARAQVVAALTQRGSLAAWGHPNTAALLTAQLRLAPAEARAVVAVAEDVGPRRALTGESLPCRFPQVAAAAAAGTINPTHVKTITQGLRRVERHATADQLVDVERTLVELAQKSQPAVIGQAVRYLLDRFDPDGEPPREDRAAKRMLTQIQHADGMVDLHAVLTPECAAKLEAVLSPLAAPRPCDANGPDERKPRQRRHDALEDLLDRFLRSGTLPDHGGVPLTVSVVIDYDQLRAEVGQVTTSHGTDLDVASLLRMAGELEIIPVVLSKADGILAYGRTKRLATKHQTKALWARDRGCSFPDCTLPPEWADRHHILAVVKDHGHTDLNNLTLVCGHHHRNFERWGWTCRMLNGRPWWTPPANLDPTQTPRMNTAHDPPHLSPTA